ncbi:bifunctional diguanylate cyclase/phosphodiesterase [Luteimonas sp. 9C]|uniref:putative bifunctional diguanylate cyclase/phosphodiesterase n=1 Tax=Luteimonas sp. 9C TaxID=2653148 RepID=UPI001F40A6FF|nr:bifunctional diguanylate cyclase/phosphodiesterase [Luteimonas sp. 9C]
MTSFVVAATASYAALSTLGRIRAAQDDTARRWWLAGGASALGVGIWSMHFIGMLAFRLPIPVGYDPWITVASCGLSVAASVYAFRLMASGPSKGARLLRGALAIGIGIAAMHYMGMASMRMYPAIEYHPGWLAASVGVAVLASGASLAIADRLPQLGRRAHLHQAMAAVAMGAAIVGMHYTGMAAARFADGAVCGAALRNGLDPDALATLVVVCTTAVLGTAILVSTLDRVLQERTGRLSASLRDANAQLSHLAQHDTLTGLPNRRLLLSRLQDLIGRALSDGGAFAVIYIDLDGFKGVNDAFGHAVGDILLARVARMLRALSHPDGMTARLGGDEFVVVAPVPSPTGAAEVAEEVLRQLGGALTLDGYDGVRVTASLGVALYPDDGTSADLLLANADAAMYHSKQSGRNLVSLYLPGMSEDAQVQGQLAHELRRALESDALALHYQPQVDGIDGRCVGVEALLRWDHPRLGMVPPMRFVAVAERMGLIVELGQWALEAACRQYADWRAAGVELPTIAVNISPVQFRSGQLVHQVESVMRRFDMPAHALTLEITESMAMQEPDRAIELLERLVQAGARISIDDFGTGYSSLAYLAQLPAHELKIDRRFVGRIDSSTRDAVIVQSVIMLAQQLGMDVVAEGVETRAQADALIRMGCRRLQGFLIARPGPACAGEPAWSAAAEAGAHPG